MSTNKKSESIQIVILHTDFARQNIEWLSRFVFHNESKALYCFSCNSVQESYSGMLKFQGVMMKANGEKQDVLLQSHVVVGLLLDQSHKNQLGFLHQEECPGK